MDFSNDLWETFSRLVVDHTQKMAEVFAVDLNELQADAPASEGSVIDLRRYLVAQRKMVSAVA